MIAVVTGAGVRVGRAIATELSAAGYTVALHANGNIAKADELAREIRARGGTASVHAADLSSPSAVSALAAELRAAYPRIDVLVNSASIFSEARFEDISADDYRRMQAINLEAPFFLTQGLLAELRKSPNALVVNMVDIAAERMLPRYAHYAVSKAGLIALTKSLAVELAPSVRVNGIAPGVVAMPDSWGEQTRAEVLERIPLSRSGAPEDVAKLVLFLARDATYVTGQIIAVDGGWSARL